MIGVELVDHGGRPIERMISEVVKILLRPVAFSICEKTKDAFVTADLANRMVGTWGKKTYVVWKSSTGEVLYRSSNPELAARFFLRASRKERRRELMVKVKTKTAKKTTKVAKKPAKKKASTIEPKNGDSRGVTTNLTITHMWNKILGANSKAKLTDDKIVSALKKEFPKRAKFQPVSRVRSWYNSGKFGYGKGEDVKLEGAARSVRYSPDGEPLGRGNSTKKKATKKKATKKKASTRRTKK